MRFLTMFTFFALLAGCATTPPRYETSRSIVVETQSSRYTTADAVMVEWLNSNTTTASLDSGVTLVRLASYESALGAPCRRVAHNKEGEISVSTICKIDGTWHVLSRSEAN